MKKFYFFIVLFLALTACGPQRRVNPNPTPHPTPGPNPTPTPTPGPNPTPIPDDLYKQALASITSGELQASVNYLSKDCDGRGTGTPEGDKAAQYVADKFKSYGLEPFDGTNYLQSFDASGKKSANVIGIIKGTTNEYIIIGAHYDHLGKGFPGADDNASGTSAIIEMAEAMSKIKTYLKRSVVLVAFGAEELGLLGSDYYISKPAFDLKQTGYMVNLDMVGYLRNKELEFLGAGSNSTVSNIITTLAKNYPELQPNITNSAGGGSDHVPFIQAGVPAMFLHTGLHENYHTANDTADKINYEGLTSISKIAFEISYMLSISSLTGTYETSWISSEVEKDHGKEMFLK